MTEDEAKEKWCPFVRYKSVRGEGINRWVEEEPQLNPDAARCIGSRCMAWRWTNQDGIDRQQAALCPGPDWKLGGGPGVQIITTYHTDEGVLRAWYRIGAPAGYCGLAGKP
jgi:hypothetical protein